MSSFSTKLVVSIFMGISLLVEASPVNIKDSPVEDLQVEKSQFNAKHSTILGAKSGETVEPDESRLLSWNTLFNVIACVIIIIFLYFLQGGFANMSRNVKTEF